MGDVLTEFSVTFRVQELTIERFDHWVWSVRPVHCTLGAGVLSLARLCTELGSVTRDEAAELADAACTLEQRLKEAFQPDRVNYLMLMMVDPQLHFHVIPRYATARKLGGIAWLDSSWPAAPVLANGSQYANSLILGQIAQVLRGA
jgi:diadenosine tetraphosphate (Ap4A) HIT family hydrolase